MRIADFLKFDGQMSDRLLFVLSFHQLRKFDFRVHPFERPPSLRGLNGYLAAAWSWFNVA